MPGMRVASPRSMTRAPAGTSRLVPTARILSPSTTTIPPSTSLPDTESKRCAALSTVTWGPDRASSACAKGALASSILNKETRNAAFLTADSFSEVWEVKRGPPWFTRSGPLSNRHRARSGADALHHQLVVLMHLAHFRD